MQAQLLAEIKRRQEQEKCRYFLPNGKQELIVKTVGEGKTYVLVVAAANGIGKTALLANILANICWGPQNKFFDLPIFRRWPYLKRIRIGSTAKQMDQGGTLDEEIKKWWPVGRYQGHKLGKNHLCLFETDTGFVLDKMSYDQDRKDWESVNLGLAVFDEPPPRDKYQATVSRLRNGGFIIIFMTPLSDAEWIEENLVDSHKENVVTITADVEDNCEEHGVRGLLKHKDIENMIAEMDPDEVEARAHGKFMHLSNVILSGSFKRDVHIVPDDYKASGLVQWGYTVDPHGGKPFAIGYWWVDERGQIVFDNEYPTTDFTKLKESKLVLADYVNMWREWEAGRPLAEGSRIFDRHFANAKDYRGRTLKEEMEDDPPRGYGMMVTNSYNCDEEIETGVLKVKAYLKYNPDQPLSATNFPHLLIKQRCKNIIKACERWKRDKDTLKPEIKSPYKDHFDVVRYTVMAEPQIYIRRALPPPKARYVPGR